MSFHKAFEEMHLQYLKEHPDEPEHTAGWNPDASPPTHCEICGKQIAEGAKLCEPCQQEMAQGYAVRSLGGRCRNGAERDHGRLFHAKRLTPDGLEYAAICGATPGPTSVGWSLYGQGKQVTCSRCLARMRMQAREQDAWKLSESRK